MFQQRPLSQTTEEEYERFPDHIVLDLAKPVKEFHEAMGKMDFFEGATEDVIREILIYVKYREDALEMLGRIAGDFERCYVDPDPNKTAAEVAVDKQIMRVLGPAVEKLGTEVLRQLTEGCLYTREGLLPYVPSQHWDEIGEVVLKKSTELLN
jgi:hypothetical protein